MVLFSSVAVLLLSGFVAADTCNGDNCLRALSGASSSGITFCHSYTNGYSVPTPTYLPSTCGPQRLSSACYCADNTANPAYTPAPCPTSQVLQNPSFWRYMATGNVDIRPWVIAVPTGAPGCHPASGYSLAYMNGNWGDPTSIECTFGTTGGKSTVTQDIVLCPSTQYTFTIHTACDFYTSTGDFGIRFRVTLNGQVIIPLQGACPICAASDPNGPPYCQGGAVYETATATFTSPASTGINSLVIEVTQASGLTGQQVPLLMDGIFLNPVGNTDMTDPSVTS